MNQDEKNKETPPDLIPLSLPPTAPAPPLPAPAPAPNVIPSAPAPTPAPGALGAPIPTPAPPAAPLVPAATGASKDAPPTIQMPADVKACKYYHGNIPRVEAEKNLRSVGDYLLRRAEVKEGFYLVLSVRREAGYVHVPLSQDKDTKLMYFEPGTKEATVIDVIGLHISRGQPINVRWNLCLKRPIVRSTWVVRHEDVFLYKKIGAGAFGEVFLARMTDPTCEYLLDCAVKTMKQEASMEAKLRFIKEARMMRKAYKHNHVVMIFGIATLDNPLLILMELCPNGSLLSYLRKNKGKVTMMEKLRFICEAASGLSHLEKMQCIHRDVAARNCLLSAKNEIKISDFGLADEKGMVIDHSLDKLPIKWLAPETMQEKIYSLKSDIWAYGITVWEIFADGEEPYPGLNRMQARAKIVMHDYRMKLPDDVAPEVVQIIDTCWDKNPDRRGTMTAHSAVLQQFYESKLPTIGFGSPAAAAAAPGASAPAPPTPTAPGETPPVGTPAPPSPLSLQPPIGSNAQQFVPSEPL